LCAFGWLLQNEKIAEVVSDAKMHLSNILLLGFESVQKTSYAQINYEPGVGVNWTTQNSAHFLYTCIKTITSQLHQSPNANYLGAKSSIKMKGK
jgi:hypothetical protein